MLSRCFLSASFIATIAGCGSGSQSPIGSIPQGAASLPDSSSISQPDLLYKTVASFGGKEDGSGPTGALVAVDGVLYGVTNSGGNDFGSLGTIYKVSKFGKVSIIHRFAGGADGSNPYNAGLLNVNGTLYGTTEDGGNGCAVGCGTVFKTSTTGAEQVLHSFAGGLDGLAPSAPLIEANGVLYGTTQIGGTSGCRGNGCGVVFKINPDGSGYDVLYRFAGGTDGAYPVAGLVEVNGKLYSTTQGGGTNKCYIGCGTIFEMSTSGSERVVYAFKGERDGANPEAGLIAVNGLLYGTTQFGGNARCGSRLCGTIFEASTSGTERVIYRFNGGIGDGAYPQTTLLYRNGTFYGTTGSGGSCFVYRTGCGTIFALYAPGNEKTIHVFGGGSDGLFPQAGLIEFDSWLYGTTGSGGTSNNCGSDGCGTVFKLAP